MPDMSPKSIQDLHTPHIHISSSMLTCEHPSELRTRHHRIEERDQMITQVLRMYFYLRLRATTSPYIWQHLRGCQHTWAQSWQYAVDRDRDSDQ